MSFQSLLQQDGEEQRWAGNGWGGSSHGSHRLRAVAEEASFVQDGDGGVVVRSGGGGSAVGVYRGEFAASLTLNTSNGGSVSGYGADLTLFSPSDLFSPPARLQQQQQVSSPFSWQSLLGGGQRWQPDTPVPGFATFGSETVEQGSSLTAYAQAEGDGKRVGDGEHHESSGSDGVINEVEVDPSGGVKEEWTNTVNPEKESWRKFGDFMIGDVKQEEYENVQEAAYILGDGIKVNFELLSSVNTESVSSYELVRRLACMEPRPIDSGNTKMVSRRKSRKRSQGHPDVIVNFEPSASSSESDSDSEESGRLKRESLSRKRKRPGQDADGNITWTDESVRFLFETYDAIHQRLWEESKGQVKYQKKWTPILKAMQARFGNHFTKKQCQSKYWSVRRECTEYRIMSTKAAATDPMWNPSIAGRELLKPKFYDVWLDVSGKNQVIVTKTKSSTVKGDVFPGELLKGEPSRVLGKDGQPVKQRMKDSGSSIKEMQRLMVVELQASEKREEAMKYRAELIMELLTQHIEHVENRVNSIDESRNPQLHLLERVNLKLEKVLDGLNALNQHLSKLHTE